MSTEQFETLFHDDLKRYLLGLNEIDERLPETPDIDELWSKIGKSFLNDGMREFQQYPTVPFGWCMYIGMAIAKYWDEDWELYNKVGNLYTYLRDRIDYDHMDDYICEKVLLLTADEHKEVANIVAKCAARTNSLLRHLPITPGSRDAFHAYVAALHQMYFMGVAMQLKRMGYHMTRI